MSDLFNFGADKKKERETYTAKDIEVLEGLEPVRKRPGMYIGGIDENAMHHLVSEVLDNAMDEAVPGFANKISISLELHSTITITDNGRGIPIDAHPKFPGKSALEIILTTLHSGGKFSGNSYETAGGLHGVGVSVVNALSSHLEVKVYRDGIAYSQSYCRGIPLTRLSEAPALKKMKGTSITFKPDPEIFGSEAKFNPAKIYELAKSKAYLYKGVEIVWNCNKEIVGSSKVPAEAVIHFPNGLRDYLYSKVNTEDLVGSIVFAEETPLQDKIKIEWALGWHNSKDGFIQSYCNTIPTPLGGTHEQGLRAALLKGAREYGEIVAGKRFQHINIEDIMETACIVLSIFIKDPLFQGQTKEKLVSQGISKPIENIIKDHFDYWFSNNKVAATSIIEHIINLAEARISRKNEKSIARKSVTQRLRLPGKLSDCTRSDPKGTELYLVEGDSAGGSAKQARAREIQAILPLRGKILNVASSSIEKISNNQEIQNLEIALGCGSLSNYKEENLRYEKIIIMSDADVDGAHIASLLMTFFYLRMPKLITAGHLYIASPPLYRINQGSQTFYASDDIQKDEILGRLMKKSKAKVEVSRFKGLGEMTALQLKETTMNPKTRTLFKVTLNGIKETAKIIDDLMGKKPEKRYEFIKEQALTRMSNIINDLDI